MSNHIYKYDLEIGEKTTLRVPHDSEIIHVGFQHGRHLRIWFEHSEPEIADLMDITFSVIGTGPSWDVPEDAVHVRSVQIIQPSGEYIWHVYELLPAKEYYGGEKPMTEEELLRGLEKFVIGQGTGIRGDRF